MKKIKRIMIILLMLILVIVGGENIVKGSYLEGGPSDSANNNDYAPGEDIKDKIEEMENKEEHENKLEEAEKKKKYSDEKKKNFTEKEILDYVSSLYKNETGSIGKIDESEEVIEAWRITMKKAGYPKDPNKGDINRENNKVFWGLQNNSESGGQTVYKYPSKLDPSVGNSEESLEDMVNDAEKFINVGELQINKDTLNNFSKTMYNILFSVGVAVAVIVGAIIGIKLMTSSIEEKAEAKKLLVPYIVGCAVVFGGFAIWKIVVTILQQI